MQKTSLTIYPACEPKPPLPAPSQFNKAEGKLFSGFNLIFKELETTFFFLQRTKNYFFLQKKEKLRFFGKKERNSKFLCRSTNYSSFALLVLLLNLFFHNGAGFSETFNHFLDRDWWDFLDDETSEYLYHCYASYLRFQDICKNSNIAFKKMIV